MWASGPGSWHKNYKISSSPIDYKLLSNSAFHFPQICSALPGSCLGGLGVRNESWWSVLSFLTRMRSWGTVAGYRVLLLACLQRDTHQRRPPSLPVIWKADALGSKSQELKSLSLDYRVWDELGWPRNRRDSVVVWAKGRRPIASQINLLLSYRASANPSTIRFLLCDLEMSFRRRPHAPDPKSTL